MKSCFLQQLKLSYIGKAKQLKNKSRVRSRGYASTTVFVFIDKLHPALEIVAPSYFISGRPIEMIRAMESWVRHKKFLQCWQRVGCMPFCITRPDNISVCLINGKRWHQGKVQRQHLCHHFLPVLRSRFCRLQPKTTRFGKTPLLISIVVFRRIMLNCPVCKQRFRQSIPMLHRIQPRSSTVECIHMINTVLVMVTRSANAQFFRFIVDSHQGFAGPPPKLDSLSPLLFYRPYPLTSSFVSYNLTARKHRVRNDSRRNNLPLFTSSCMIHRPG